MSDKVIHAFYDDDDVLLSAVKEIVSKKHHIDEVYTPFPVHGLDKAFRRNTNCYNGFYIWMYWPCSFDFDDESYDDS